MLEGVRDEPLPAGRRTESFCRDLPQGLARRSSETHTQSDAGPGERFGYQPESRRVSMSRFTKLTDAVGGTPVWVNADSIVSVEARSEYDENYKWGARTLLFFGDFKGCTQEVREHP